MAMRDRRALRLSLDDVRLLALDVDGTLIDDQFRLPPRTRALLTWLVREAGKRSVSVRAAIPQEWCPTWR